MARGRPRKEVIPAEMFVDGVFEETDERHS